MKSIRTILRLSALALGLCTVTALVADEAPSKQKEPANAAKPAGELAKATAKDAAFLAKARADYPLKTCVTSDEALGSMGENAEFIYREKGKPDRLVVFCCEGCEDDFKKEPAKYLAKIDAAAKQNAAAK